MSSSNARPERSETYFEQQSVQTERSERRYEQPNGHPERAATYFEYLIGGFGAK
jgi:hypothetical protein